MFHVFEQDMLGLRDILDCEASYRDVLNDAPKLILPLAP